MARLRELVAASHPTDSMVSCAACCDSATRRTEIAKVVPAALERLERLEAESARLRERQQEHLALIARISQSTPLAIEIEGWEAQRAAFMAEVGTLRARVAEMERLMGGSK